MKGALAIFVKTPGHSALKTRLADTLGGDFAREFYSRSLQAVHDIAWEVAKHPDNSLQPYWAIAEGAQLSNPLWKDFPGLAQESGNLGERLAHVYSTLLKDHPFVLMIGSDAPQITPDLIAKASRLASQSAQFILGPAEDGGFYLFGGSTPVPAKVWTSVPYSQNSTAGILAQKILSFGRISYLPSLQDVDREADLAGLCSQLLGSPLPSQHQLLEWLTAHPLLKRRA